MTTKVSVNPQDVAVAANILEQYLSDSVSEGDFSPGTALRDLSIGALASLYAFLRAESVQVRQMQSLNSVQTAVSDDPDALRDAVTAILSNVLVAPKSGVKARGLAVGHVSQRVDIFIPVSARFTRTTGVVFTVAAATTYFIPKDELVPILDTNGAVIEYQFRIPLVAARTGTAHNIDPGFFSSFDRVSPYLTRVENVDKFAGGRGDETVTEILTRAPTAISVRNLINDRSIAATLEDYFGGDINFTFVVGMGMPEMQRDRVQFLTNGLQLHAGGMADIYLHTALVETTFTGEVGALFARPDELVTVFRDLARPGFNVGVQPGDILRVTAGLPVVPAEFLIIAIDGDDLVLSDKAPFPVATDENSPVTYVSYTIGRIGAEYADVDNNGGGAWTMGQTSRRVRSDGRITLPGGPVMDILDVALLNPPVAEDAYKDDLDGFVHFTNRVNTTPALATDPLVALQFRTIVHNPFEAQSYKQWMDVQVGQNTNLTRYDGYLLRVRYRTLSAFASIDAFVRGRDERTLAASQLCRAHHPVVVNFQLEYKLKTTATALLNDAAIGQTLVDFINTFDTKVCPIDASAIEAEVRRVYPTISAVRPLLVGYVLTAPTGDLLTYSTLEEVRIDAALQVGGPTLDLAGYGVTDRTIRYIANTANVTARRWV